MRSPGLVAALAAACAALAFAPAAQAVSAKQALKRLNAQRAAHGLPSDVKLSKSLSKGCRLHNRYQRSNGRALTHQEARGRRGYTKAGARAALGSVLAAGTAWRSTSPWENAPIHLAQLLDPRLGVTGIDASSGFTCANTLSGRKRAGAPTARVYTYPGDGTTHRRSDRAFEGPYPPGTRVGIRNGATTGPYLYVLADGPWAWGSDARVQSASLMDSDGRPVEIKTVDNNTNGLQRYFNFTGGMLIPVRPLKKGETYTASVTLTVNGRRLEHTWSFTAR